MKTIDFSAIAPTQFCLYDHNVDLKDRMQSAQTVALQLVKPLLLIDPTTILDFRGIPKAQSKWIATILAYIKKMGPLSIKLPKGLHERNVESGRAFVSSALPWTYRDQNELRVLIARRINTTYEIVEFCSEQNFNQIKLMSLIDSIKKSAYNNLYVSTENLQQCVDQLNIFSKKPVDISVSIADIPEGHMPEPHDHLMPVQFMGMDIQTNDPCLVQELLWNIRA